MSEFNADCAVPPYTDEQVMILNMQKGIDDLVNSVAALPTRSVQMHTMVHMVNQADVLALLEQFKKDFQDGKIA